MNVRQEGHMIERAIRFLRVLEENGIEPDNISEKMIPKELLSMEDREELPETCEFLRFMDEIPGGFFICFSVRRERSFGNLPAMYSKALSIRRIGMR